MTIEKPDPMSVCCGNGYVGEPHTHTSGEADDKRLETEVIDDILNATPEEQAKLNAVIEGGIDAKIGELLAEKLNAHDCDMVVAWLHRKVRMAYSVSEWARVGRERGYWDYFANRVNHWVKPTEDTPKEDKKT